MQLRGTIQIRSRFIRSVHIERDREIPEALDNYILTKKASEVCTSILTAYMNISSSDRAWTITGPYGTGKSSLALLLIGLFDNSKSRLNKTARLLHQKEITSEKNNVLRDLPKMGPAAVASLTATPNLLLPQLARTVSLAVSIACKALGHKSPAHFSHKALDEKFRNCSVDQVVGILEDISRFIVKSGGSGLVIIIDELGKILENAVKSNSSSDVYLLQAIAESAARSGKTRLAIVGFLHQSFESYARTAGSSVEREWSKIHGRFADVAYIQSAEEMLNIIAQAFVHDLPSKTAKRIHSWAHEWTSNLQRNKILISAPHDTLARIFQSCYPLSPITALILPLLCQRFAQNDRTMFSLLASDDPSALGGFMLQNKATFEQDRVVAFTPSRLYDYFINSRLIIPADPIHLRRWAELQSVLDRAANGTPLELGLLKTIGILNIIGAYGTLMASTIILKYALNDDGYTNKEVDRALDSLKQRSFIIYRKFSNEWRIWEGSDIDLDSEVLHAREKIIPGFNAADHLNKLGMLRPIVATRHSYQTGSVRSFDVLAVSSVDELLNRAIDPKADASIYLIIAPSDQATESEEIKASTLKDTDALFAIHHEPTKIISLCLESAGLKLLSEELPTIQGDPVASRELNIRKTLIRQELENEVRILQNGSDSNIVWIWHGKRHRLNRRAELQKLLSDIFDQLYVFTPIIWNELINRKTLSSQAAAARNRLLGRMISHSHETNLGFEKHPPELSIYKSVLYNTKLHRQRDDGTWEFVPAGDDCDPNIKKTWQAMISFLDESQKTSVPIQVLFDRLNRKPYGIKSGILPIFFLALYLTNESEIALFENGSFVPIIALEVMERLVRQPSLFTVQCVRIEGTRAELFREYAMAIRGSEVDSPKILELVRPLARFIKSLPEYTLNTKELSREGISVREALKEARSPTNLLFQDLPKACGYTFNFNTEVSFKVVKTFMQRFRLALQELNGAYGNLQKRIQAMTRDAFHLANSAEKGRFELASRARPLLRYTIEPQLRAFLSRLTDDHLEDQEWWESIATLLAKKPPSSWTDADTATFDLNLSQIARRFRNIEALRLTTENLSDYGHETFEAVRICVTRHDGAEVEEVVHLLPGEISSLDKVESEILKRVEGLDKRLQIALFAKLFEHEFAKTDSKIGNTATDKKNSKGGTV